MIQDTRILFTRSSEKELHVVLSQRSIDRNRLISIGKSSGFINDFNRIKAWTYLIGVQKKGKLKECSGIYSNYLVIKTFILITGRVVNNKYKEIIEKDVNRSLNSLSAYSNIGKAKL